MSNILLSAVLALGLAACSSGAAEQKAADERTAVVSRPYIPSERTLASGTQIEARIQNELSSRRNEAGETLVASVSEDVKDDNGQVVILAGSSVGLTIGQLEPATNKGQKDGKISLSVTSISVRGQSYDISADLEPVEHHMQGRGVSSGAVEKVGIGTAVGALAGGLIGKNTKGVVVGGAVGAGAGTIYAVQSADRDVVVSAGQRIKFSLNQQLSVSTK